MKIRITFLSLLAVSVAMVASAQVVENDDMYFNSKDRARVAAAKPLTLKSISSEHEVATAINPTDSYSARNVNPEYISQSTVNPSGSSAPATYFTPNYTPTAVNQNLNKSSSGWNNCNCATAGNNPYFGMMPGYGYGSNYPYMSSMYGYNPYSYGYNGFNSMYNSGWSSMLSLGFGMGGYYPYGGSSLGMGGSSFWNNYYGMNYYSGWGMNSYYPNRVVVINNNDYNNHVVYGKRASRSSDLNNVVTSNGRSATMVTTDSQGRVRGSNGRVASDGNTSNNAYYQRGWRANPETNSALRSTYSNGTRSGADDSGFSNRSNFGSSNSRNSNSSFFDNGGSRSSGFGGGSNFSSGGGSRGSVGGGGGGSSSGARRGRD